MGQSDGALPRNVTRVEIVRALFPTRIKNNNNNENNTNNQYIGCNVRTKRAIVVLAVLLVSHSDRRGIVCRSKVGGRTDRRRVCGIIHAGRGVFFATTTPDVVSARFMGSRPSRSRLIERTCSPPPLQRVTTKTNRDTVFLLSFSTRV